MAPFYLLAISLAKLLGKGAPGGVRVVGEDGSECQRQLRNPELKCAGLCGPWLSTSVPSGPAEAGPEQALWMLWLRDRKVGLV